MSDVSGQSAIVTGAGRGFGEAIATTLAQAGVRVTLAARTGREVDVVRDRIRRSGGEAESVAADLAVPESAERVVAAHVEAYGAADILVNCAGTGRPYGPVGALDADAWWSTVSLNLQAPLRFMNLVLPAMRERGSGCIVNVASLAGTFPTPMQSAYGVSKAAVIRLSEIVAAENADAGVSVFAVHPGFVFTELARSDADADDARRWSPEFVAMLERLRDSGGGTEGLAVCGRRVLDLARHDHDHLSGTFIDFTEGDVAHEIR